MTRFEPQLEIADDVSQAFKGSTDDALEVGNHGDPERCWIEKKWNVLDLKLNARRMDGDEVEGGSACHRCRQARSCPSRVRTTSMTRAGSNFLITFYPAFKNLFNFLLPSRY